MDIWSYVCSTSPLGASALKCIVDVAPALSAGIVIFSVLVAIGSLLVAVLNILRNQTIARQRATLDLIEKFESNDRYRKYNQTFRTYRDARLFHFLGDPKKHGKDDKNIEELGAARQDVLDYLNHYELVAIGIRAGILDEWFYKYWMGGTFVKDWNAASTFIQQERWRWNDSQKKWIYHEEMWAEYQTLALKWSEEATPLDKSSGKPQSDAPSGPGDAHYPLTR